MKTWIRIPTDEEIRAVRAKYALRRADRFTSLAVAGVVNSDEPDLASLAGDQTALVTWSMLGPHKTVFATLDDILDYPEELMLPTKFSHSVQNAAASYLGQILRITGPTFATSGFDNPREEALALARTLLQAGDCRRVLVVGIAERGILTAALPKLMPEIFPSEPQEGVEVVLLEGDGEDMERTAY